MVKTLFLIKALKEGFVGILLTLDTLIYGLVSSSFKVFMSIASARLLSSEAYTEIANKIYIIVGVLMLFVLSYAILRGIIDPDQGAKNEFGPKMVKHVIIAVVGLAIAPVIFNLMYQVQGLILEQDVLGKLFFRIESKDSITLDGQLTSETGTINQTVQVNPDEYVKSVGGAVTAVNLWQAFFYPSEDSGKNAEEIVASADDYFLSAAGNGLLCAGMLAGAAGLATIPVVGWIFGGALAIGAGVTACASTVTNTVAGVNAVKTLPNGEISLAEAYAYASSGEGFGIFTVFLKNYSDDGEISYLFGISTIAGAFALYAFVSFSIDMGIRAAKLAYLQIIAPIPLIMQVLPKFKDTFNTYIKSVVSTFIEVFIRISVVYIVVYLISHLTDLFSSVGTWGDNSSLNAAEKLFALAFLILGLIAFCRKAPEIIAETLHLPKSSMNLGIAKKLSEGGAFTAASIAGGALTGAAKNFKVRERGSRPLGAGERALSAVRGFASGAARATMMNVGPGHKPADTWRQATDIAGNAGSAAFDAYDRSNERRGENEEARQQATAAREAVRTARADRAASIRDLEAAELNYGINSQEYKDALARYDAAQQKVEEAVAQRTAAEKAAFRTTALGAMADNLEQRAKSWSTGTVSTKEEEAAVRFGSALDSLKGDLREEAYKKDATARQLYNEYNRLKNESINEYAEGWDEQSYNREYRRRLNSVNRDANVVRNMNAYKTAQADVIAARNILSGLQEGTAQYDLAKQDLANKQALEQSARSSLEAVVRQTNLGTLRADGTIEVDMSDIRIDQAQARAERDRQLEGLRQAMEAAADKFVMGKATDQNSNTARDIQKFITENIAYINKHSNSEIVIGYEKDANGEDDPSKPIRKRLSELLEDAFGTTAINDGRFVLAGDEKTKFTRQEEYEFEMPDKTKIIYKKDGHQYKAYDTAGNEIQGYGTVDESSFFEFMRQKIADGTYSKVGANTAITKVGDAGKVAANYVRNNDLARKMQIQRQEQENKGGKK